MRRFKALRELEKYKNKKPLFVATKKSKETMYTWNIFHMWSSWKVVPLKKVSLASRDHPYRHSECGKNVKLSCLWVKRITNQHAHTLNWKHPKGFHQSLNRCTYIVVPRGARMNDLRISSICAHFGILIQDLKSVFTSRDHPYKPFECGKIWCCLL